MVLNVGAISFSICDLRLCCQQILGPLAGDGSPLGKVDWAPFLDPVSRKLKLRVVFTPSAIEEAVDTMQAEVMDLGGPSVLKQYLAIIQCVQVIDLARRFPDGQTREWHRWFLDCAATFEYNYRRALLGVEGVSRSAVGPELPLSQRGMHLL